MGYNLYGRVRKTMLEIKKLTKYYGEFKAVDNLNITLKDGEMYGLLGVNGAGKTTTFRMIMGLLEPSEGTILLDGKKIDNKVTDKIGFLTEERSLLLKLTVKEQLLFYGALKSLDSTIILDRMAYWLEKFGIKEYENKKIKELSKGNQQKVQFIAAVINEPKLLILDEPFSGLDPINVEMFKAAILEMKSKGTTILFSSHRMDHVELFCENIVILLKGKTVLEGNLFDIKKSFRKKNIFIAGDIDVERLKCIKGVVDVVKEGLDYKVIIEEDYVAEEVFGSLNKESNVTKFVVEMPSLNEIFIEKVGEAYEK